MSKTKTQEQFIAEVYNLVKDEYTVLGNYKNNSTKILMRHNSKNCNNFEWEVSPNPFLNGSRCPKCFGNIKKTTEQFKREVYDLTNGGYEVLGEYKNSLTKIKIKHKSEKCNNHEFDVLPGNFLRGSRCPICSLINKIKSEELFKKQIFNLVGEEYSPLDEYTKANN